ncbi:MAG: flavodoxin family protein [Deltaproteobacteria bacterium]|jgi:multimeric flavodoxin WrbA|nr:flavodoxin family protein [Deltaproteobacteria bacterium]
MSDKSGVKVLGLHMSPRARGSSARLLESFAAGVKRAGAEYASVSVSGLDIKGCSECYRCGESGVCAVDSDDMGKFYAAWEEVSGWGEAGLSPRIVISTPVFFYDMPSQGKAVLDRSQAFWVRRYVLGMNKDGIPGAKGFLLACGATKGKDLFVPVTLAVKYLFDAIGFPKSFQSLTFRQIERPDKFSQEQLAEAERAGFEFAQA